jgi:hypothetical protein
MNAPSRGQAAASGGSRVSFVAVLRSQLWVYSHVHIRLPHRQVEATGRIPGRLSPSVL